MFLIKTRKKKNRRTCYKNIHHLPLLSNQIYKRSPNFEHLDLLEYFILQEKQRKTGNLEQQNRCYKSSSLVADNFTDLSGAKCHICACIPFILQAIYQAISALSCNILYWQYFNECLTLCGYFETRAACENCGLLYVN